MNATTIAPIAASFVITGRGARIKHVNVDGTVLCGKDKATQDASGRFEKLPVCGTCDAALVELKAQAVDAALEASAAERETAAPAPAEVEAAAPAAPQVEGREVIEIHFSARVAKFMAEEIVNNAPTMSAQLKAARLVRNGRGFTAFVTTDRINAMGLVADMTRLLEHLESGQRAKGLKGGMNFQPEAVAKGIEHITADLHRVEVAA